MLQCPTAHRYADTRFNKACTPFNQMMLLGLYQGSFKCSEITPEMVHTWRREGLFREIKRVFEVIPSQCREEQYPWFLEHQDLLDPSLESSTKAAEDFAFEATMRLGLCTDGIALIRTHAIQLTMPVCSYLVNVWLLHSPQRV